MAETSAQRQAAYRQKHLFDIEGTKSRVNLVIDGWAWLSLARLAKRYGVTKSACLERILLETQERELSLMSAKESSAFYDAVTP